MTAIRNRPPVRGAGALTLRAAVALVAAVLHCSVIDAAELGNNNAAAMREVICHMIDGAAAANRLPSDFLTRVIWQESRFHSNARSPAGAEGVAQFMPQTAVARGLSDPDDPAQAIAQAARLLASLYLQFGNLGLAAAAYNAGGGRVARWLQGQSELPGETRRYVITVTGYEPERWRGHPAAEHPAPTAYQRSCMAVTDELARTAPPPASPLPAFPARAPAAIAQLDGSLAKVIELLQARPPPRRAAPSPAQASVDALCASIRTLGANCQVVTRR